MAFMIVCNTAAGNKLLWIDWGPFDDLKVYGFNLKSYHTHFTVLKHCDLEFCDMIPFLLKK